MGNSPAPVVDGSALSDLIVFGFTDVQGDIVDNGEQIIQALAGDDIVAAAGGNDIVHGGSGNDRIEGNGGHDRLFGGADDDAIYGGAGRDRVYGGNGDDLIDGGDGADQLRGGRGNDTLYGAAGNDRIFGNKGNNELYGGDGNDFLSSGDQTSVLDGGADNDTLVLRAKKGGDHVATGGSGADSFEFVQLGKRGVSEMTITDFELGTDAFSLDGVDGALYLSFIGEAAVTSSGDDTLLTLTTGDTILFEGITETEFETFYGL